MSLRVALVGSRGIPARYGGNETFVEEISRRLVKKGVIVYVTCESDAFYEDEWAGIKRIHSFSIQNKNFTIPFINDVISTVHLLLRRRDDVGIVYYVAPDGVLASLIAKVFGKKILINPDGIEWRRPLKRMKFSTILSRVLHWIAFISLLLAEHLSVKFADVVVADSFAIKRYLEKRYRAKNVVYVPYGARKLIPKNSSWREEVRMLSGLGIEGGEYYLTVSRIVAENNIHLELEGFKKARSRKSLVIVGNFNKKDPYVRYLFRLRGQNGNIIFLGPIYDRNKLGILRRHCFAYIHPYEVGGTNPSLIEQMQFGKPILAYDVPFNREVLREGGIYFKNAEDLAAKLEMLEAGYFDLESICESQIRRIQKEYNWDAVAERYYRLLNELMREG